MLRFRFRALLLLALACAPAVALSAPGAAAAPAPDDRVVLLGAMKEELGRSVRGLRLAGHQAPYFIAYQLKDLHSHVIAARYGAIFQDQSRRDGKLYVDVRVGSYEDDSGGGADDSPFFGGGEQGPTYLAQQEAPVSVDPLALRNALWLLTDEKFKAALSAWHKKKAQSVYALDGGDDEKSGAFTHEEATRFIQPASDFPFDRARWKGSARAISGVFSKHPDIFDSEVRVSADKVVRLQVNSEGTELVTEETIYAVHVQAVTRAPDGQLLDNSRDFYAASEAELPTEPVMLHETGKMIAELLALRRAPVIDPYTGPAILAPEATGVLFHETVGHRLEGDRQGDDNEGRTFKGQIGKRVLPSFLSVIDDPTRARVGKVTLNGFYRYDDEGVRATRTTLIENGVLRAFLLSRKPVKGFSKSNGHGRAQANRRPVARMANLEVRSGKTVPYAKLREMLLAEARRAKKPYALIIRDITGGNTNTSTYGYQAFKGVPRLVYRVDAKTGKEELVRGVEIVGTPLTTINKIVAMGDEVGIFNGYCGAESGYVPVSTVAPAALITEIELQRTARAKERSPILSGPWAVEKAAGAKAR